MSKSRDNETEQMPDKIKLDKITLNKINQALDSGAENLDADVSRRLRMARHEAVEQLAQREQKKPSWHLWQPIAGGMALATVAAISIGINLSSHAVVEPDVFEDLTLLSASDEFELYEDMDFYYWLEIQSEQG